MLVPIRVFIAGSRGHPLAKAALERLSKDSRVVVVGIGNDRIEPEHLRRLKPDLIVSAAHPYLLRAAVLGIPRLGAVGLHPSALPHNRGSYPLWWTLRCQEATTALSLFHLRPAIDSGPVIDQRTVRVMPDDTFQTLYERVSKEVGPVLGDLVTAIVEHSGVPGGVPQAPGGIVVVTTPPIVLRAWMKLYWSLRRVGLHALSLMRRPG